jgi:hypothetical protein
MPDVGAVVAAIGATTAVARMKTHRNIDANFSTMKETIGPTLRCE